MDIKSHTRFRMRSLLIGLTVVCVGLAWLVEVHDQVRQREDFRANFRDREFSVRGDDVSIRRYVDGKAHPRPRPRLPWIRVMMDDWPASDLMYEPAKDPDGEQLRRTRELFPEANIWGWPADETPLPEGVERLPDNYSIWL